ncbi:response regulator transcription factor [Massilia terrae]|uniref:Response regulator transcription factor n=1 Tax=Massilia terrae TaxID=1811224 RepID=A0ABT2CYF1_9BURK|nr:response regulator transcription factor [Massilia terrae]MCS0659009.1 response regulator transcription factor [Massilia terrae]
MITVELIDEDVLILEGLKGYLSTASEVLVVGEARDSYALAEQGDHGAVHVVILEVNEAGDGWTDAIRRVRAVRPDSGILVLSHFRNSDYALIAIRAGAMGMLQKNCSVSDLVNAVFKAASGIPYVDDALCELLFIHAAGANSPPSDKLSGLELAILRLLVSGRTVVQASEIVGLSVGQLRWRRTKLMQKLGARSVGDLCDYARHHHPAFLTPAA